MKDKLMDENMKFLFRAILALETEEECANFFEDLCTMSEIKDMAQRLRVAQMLREKHVYTAIVKETGASTATISRVNRCLAYGADGYNAILERIEEKK